MKQNLLDFFAIVFVLIVGFSLVPKTTFAQDAQILSVTPPLFQLSIAPGDIWQSNIKVVNGNPYPLTVYTEVVNFSATGEDGQGRFAPIFNKDPEGSTLAHWIQIANGPHVIPPEQTKDVSFFVEVPEDASPGGHYAAILVSTEAPSTGSDKKMAVLTSQAVTSLFFLKIEGDIDERGTIREFAPTDSFLEKPEVEFSLRFENKGNVHLQPRGDILITNMWGTERGKIPVNYQTHFGNVLPKSIRDFRFQWESDFKITDIGRYTAEVSLTFGEEGIKSEVRKTHFWVVPIKATLLTLLIFIAFVSLIVLMIKSYIRRMLSLAGVNPNQTQHNSTIDIDEHDIEIRKTPKVPVTAPIKSGVLDLRAQLSGVRESVDVLKTIVSFIVDYKRFFISVFLLIVIFVVSVLYISTATEENRDYTITVDEGSVTPVVEQR